MSWNEAVKQSVALEWREGRVGAGGVGVVDGLRSLVFGAGEEGELTRDELLCLTSAAFKHYVYEERYNPPYEPERYYSYKGDMFSNYGIIESFAQATGWEVREFNFLELGDLAKLMAFEMGEGRGMLSYDVEEPRVCGLSGVEVSPTSFQAEVLLGSGGGRVTLDVRARGGLQDVEREEDLVNWCVVARPAEPGWAMSLSKRRLGVWRWAIKHARNKKEFFHETRENYAPGLSGYESLAGGVATRLEGLGEGGEEMRRWLEAHLEELHEGRGAAARRIEAWAVALFDASDVEVRGDRADLERAAREAAGAYEDASALCATALEQVREGAEWSGAVREGGAREARGIEALERLIEGFAPM